jgi:hypothetical protein
MSLRDTLLITCYETFTVILSIPSNWFIPKVTSLCAPLCMPVGIRKMSVPTIAYLPISHSASLLVPVFSLTFISPNSDSFIHSFVS